MKKTGYILFILWLSTVVLSNAFTICKSFYEKTSIELTEKESKDKSSDDADDSDEDNEKKSEDKSEKELLAYKSFEVLPTEILAVLSDKSQIPANDEDFVSSLYVILPENPPEL